MEWNGICLVLFSDIEALEACFSLLHVMWYRLLSTQCAHADGD